MKLLELVFGHFNHTYIDITAKKLSLHMTIIADYVYFSQNMGSVHIFKTFNNTWIGITFRRLCVYKIYIYKHVLRL